MHRLLLTWCYLFSKPGSHGPSKVLMELSQVFSQVGLEFAKATSNLPDLRAEVAESFEPGSRSSDVWMLVSGRSSTLSTRTCVCFAE